MNEHPPLPPAALPARNQDEFHIWPINMLVGVLEDPDGLAGLLDDLRLVGVDVGRVRLLSGPAGVDVLDRNGRRHGLLGRVIRAVQAFGDDQNMFTLYDEALHAGRLLVEIPIPSAEADDLAELLQQQGRALRQLAWFGHGSLRTIPGP